ncbi:hypothetical protein [Aureispira anguillae]|nr:hypothetical protein [Aureispira anguillae]
MRFLFFITCFCLSSYCFCQDTMKIDTLEYATITTEEYCAIFNDSLIKSLHSKACFFRSYNNDCYSFDELVTIALLNNTYSFNAELLKRKGIDLCGRANYFAPKNQIWTAYHDYLEGFWGWRDDDPNETSFFYKKGLICLKPVGKKAFLPFYRLTSQKKDLRHLHQPLQLIKSFVKDGGIQRDSLIRFCEENRPIKNLFTNLDRAISHIIIVDAQNNEIPSSELYFLENEINSFFSEEQKQFIKQLKAGQTFTISLIVVFTDLVSISTAETGPLIYQVVD